MQCLLMAISQRCVSQNSLNFILKLTQFVVRASANCHVLNGQDGWHLKIEGRAQFLNYYHQNRIRIYRRTPRRNIMKHVHHISAKSNVVNTTGSTAPEIKTHVLIAGVCSTVNFYLLTG